MFNKQPLLDYKLEEGQLVYARHMFGQNLHLETLIINTSLSES